MKAEAGMLLPCGECHLRQRRLFRPFSEGELDFVTAMKSDHLTLSAKAEIAREGEVGGTIYTLFEGWAVRYHRLPNGSRQILDILLPGDMIGLESVMLGTVKHSVEAITPVSLCALNGRKLEELFDRHPGFAFSILRARVEEEQRADVRLSLLGRRTAVQRVGYLMLETCDRLRQRDMVSGGGTFPFPLTRRHLADATGLSPTHLNRGLNTLRQKELAAINEGVIIIRNEAALAELAGYVPVTAPGRRAIL